MDCNMPGFPFLHHLLKLAQTHVHWVSDAIQPSHPLLPSSPTCPQSFPASRSFPVSQLFASGGQSIVASALASILSMNIQGRFPSPLTGFDLLAVQGTLKSLFQHHNLKASILRCSAFFIVRLSHLYVQDVCNPNICLEPTSLRISWQLSSGPHVHTSLRIYTVLLTDTVLISESFVGG